MRRRKKRIDLTHWKTYVVLIGLFLSFFAFLSARIISLGYRIERTERHYQELMSANQMYQAEFMRLCSPDELRTLMQHHGVALNTPSEWAFVDVTIREEKGSHGLETPVAEANTR